MFESYVDDAAVVAHRASTHFKELVIGKIVPLLESREVILTMPEAMDRHESSDRATKKHGCNNYLSAVLFVLN